MLVLLAEPAPEAGLALAREEPLAPLVPPRALSGVLARVGVALVAAALTAATFKHDNMLRGLK